MKKVKLNKIIERQGIFPKSRIFEINLTSAFIPEKFYEQIAKKCGLANAGEVRKTCIHSSQWEAGVNRNVFFF